MTDDVEITEIKRSSGLLPLPIEDIKKKKKNSKSKKRREEKEQLSPPVKGSQIFSNKKETEGITVNDVDDKPESSSPKQSEDDDLKRFENIKVSTNDEKKKKSKNTRRKKKKISDSTFSLENDFQPEVLRDLQDDIQSDDNFSIHPDEWNPHLHPRVLTPSKLSSKIYVEKNHGFTNVSQKKVIASQLAFISDVPIESGPHKSKVRSTPIELALETQKMFHSLCIFCHGLLGGIAFWQILTVHVPGESGLKFARNYSPMSQPLQVIFYLLTAICTVSVFDRYDVTKINLKRIQSMVTLQSGGLAVLIYTFSLMVTLSTTRLDDKLNLYQLNATMFNNEELEVMEKEINTWKTLNLCRCISVILGWIIISVKPNTDLLYKHLKELADYSSEK